MDCHSSALSAPEGALAGALRRRQYDLLICESGLDQAVALERTAKLQILDLPCPFGDELLYAGDISPASHGRIRAMENRSLSAPVSEVLKASFCA